MAIYLKYEGIKGNATGDYADHIAVSSINFGVSRAVSMEAGNLANRETSKPNLSEITITKTTDMSTAPLFKSAVGGSDAKNAELKFARTGKDKLEEYMVYKLEKCVVSGYTMSAYDEGVAEETITLSYGKIEISYTGADAANKAAGPQRAGYDLEAAKTV
jgi:type VI secretion system secreted protein Hcp